MRTLAIIFAILAVILLAAVLIAPNLDLDDYSDQPFFRLFVLLLSFLLQMFRVCACIRLLHIDLRSRPTHIPEDSWLPSTLATTAPLPLLC
jgi:hypothetical protein